MQPQRGLKVWFRDEIHNALASVADSGRETVAAMAMSDPDAARLYQDGHTAALRAVALAFGITLSRQNEQVCSSRSPTVIDVEYKTR